jgi:serine/threonine-protein phosphatase 5
MSTKVDELKKQGNECFGKHKYEQAVSFYSEALELDPGAVALYTNRALANLRLEMYGAALSDADEAIKLDSKWIKAFYRRGEARAALGRYREAMSDFGAVLKVHPRDKLARQKYQSCVKEVKRIAFELAIATDDEKLTVEEVDWQSCAVPSGYDGPELAMPLTRESVTAMVEWFRSERVLAKRYAHMLVQSAYRYFVEQPTLVSIELDDSDEKEAKLRHLHVCGDVHGQFYDVLNLFDNRSGELTGAPSEKNAILFNGDFVDRGSFSCEVILTFLAYKLLYPRHFFMSRGNHESVSMTRMYGFEGECKHKYGPKCYQMFVELFRVLPLAHLINRRVLVVHGGLFSRDDVTLDDIAAVDRVCEPPDAGVMAELLWSDPQPQLGRWPSKRGVAISFGPDVTADFCQRNDLALVVRSHEVKEQGYELHHNRQCITVFSAPNYCDQVGNLGAFLTFTPSTLPKPKITTFAAVDHPNVRPMQYANPLLRM